MYPLKSSHGDWSISRQAVYDPNNFYLVHLDRKDNATIRGDLETFIKDWENVRCVSVWDNASFYSAAFHSLLSGNNFSVRAKRGSGPYD